MPELAAAGESPRLAAESRTIVARAVLDRTGITRDWVWRALALMLAVTPVAAADDDQDKYAPQTVVAAERRLSSAGATLGAASMCRDTDRGRIRAAMLKVNELIDKGVDNNRQYYAGKNIFAKGMDEGKDAIKRGRTDCRRAESDLTVLEEQLGH